MRKYIILLVAMMAIMSGCKRNEWLDWKAENVAWLEQNKLNHADDPYFHISSTGLQYRITYEGNIYDARPSATSSVICTYEGRLINGARFDGGTAQFTVSQLIPGFAEGLKKIHNHGDIELYIPYTLGYSKEAGMDTDGTGSEGTSGYIPPYSTLIFTVHLGAVN